MLCGLASSIQAIYYQSFNHNFLNGALRRLWFCSACFQTPRDVKVLKNVDNQKFIYIQLSRKITRALILL
jgi:hypothetical protein